MPGTIAGWTHWSALDVTQFVQERLGHLPHFLSSDDGRQSLKAFKKKKGSDVAVVIRCPSSWMNCCNKGPRVSIAMG